MHEIRLKKKLPDNKARALSGQSLNIDSFDTLIEKDVDVYKPNGELLLKYRTNVIPAAVCEKAFPLLRKIHEPVTNRSAAGLGFSEKQRRKNGTASNTVRINLKDHPEMKNASTSIIGYYDRYTRFPFCRQTAFNLNNPKGFLDIIPYIQAADRVFAKNVPDRYANQLSAVHKTKANWVIHRTAFTTMTVNKNWQTKVHIDAGDLKEGFGIMAAFRAGHYDGCYLVFPAFRIAVDMQTAGLLMADVHELHGNTPLIGVKGFYERVSIILYYREKMQQCLRPEEELERAKRYFGDPRKRGAKLW